MTTRKPSQTPQPRSDTASTDVGSDRRRESTLTRTTSQTPQPAKEVNRRKQLRDQILLLKKSLPNNTEIIKIMDEHPEEGVKFVEYCTSIQNKIQELEQQRRALRIEQEDARREAATTAAQQRYQNKKQRIINNWMEKELNAEDRFVEKAEERERQKEAKLLEEQASREEIAKARAAHEKEKMEHLQSRRVRWNRAVSAIEQSKKEHKLAVDFKLHEKGLTFAARMQKQKRQEEERQRQLEETQRQATRALLDHVDRAKERHDERRRAAHELSAQPLAHPRVKLEKLERTTTVLKERAEKEADYLERLFQEQEQKIAERKQQRRQKWEEAQARLREERQRQLDRMAAVEAELARRLAVHDEQVKEREQILKERQRRTAAKQKRCRDALSQKVEDGHAAISQRLIDRTLRIGSNLGVEAKERLVLSSPTSPSQTPLRIRSKKRKATGSENGQHLRLVLQDYDVVSDDSALGIMAGLFPPPEEPSEEAPKTKPPKHKSGSKEKDDAASKKSKEHSRQTSASRRSSTTSEGRRTGLQALLEGLDENEPEDSALHLLRKIQVERTSGRSSARSSSPRPQDDDEKTTASNNNEKPSTGPEAN